MLLHTSDSNCEPIKEHVNKKVQILEQIVEELSKKRQCMERELGEVKKNYKDKSESNEVENKSKKSWGNKSWK